MSEIQYTSVLDTNIHRPVPVSDLDPMKRTLELFDAESDKCAGMNCLQDLNLKATNAFSGTHMGRAALTELLGLRMDKVYNTKIAKVRIERLEQQLSKNTLLRNEAYEKDAYNVLNEERDFIEKEIANQLARIKFFEDRK